MRQITASGQFTEGNWSTGRHQRGTPVDLIISRNENCIAVNVAIPGPPGSGKLTPTNRKLHPMMANKIVALIEFLQKTSNGMVMNAALREDMGSWMEEYEVDSNDCGQIYVHLKLYGDDCFRGSEASFEVDTQLFLWAMNETDELPEEIRCGRVLGDDDIAEEVSNVIVIDFGGYELEEAASNHRTIPGQNVWSLPGEQETSKTSAQDDDWTYTRPDGDCPF